MRVPRMCRGMSLWRNFMWLVRFAGQIFAAATSEDDCAVGASPFPLAVAFGCWLEKFESAGRLLLPVVNVGLQGPGCCFWEFGE